MLDLEKFYTCRPVIYHMAQADAWPQIKRHGLLSTQILLDRLQLTNEERATIANERKCKSVPRRNASFGLVTLRDQCPLNEKKLEKALEPGTTVIEWSSLLNRRVFFWAQKKSLDGFLGAKNYRHHPQLVIAVNTRKLFEAYKGKIEVADINTGSLLYNPALRGKDTFQPIATYARYKKRQIVEVTVLDGVPDFTNFVKRAVRREPTGSETLLRGTLCDQ
jgi:hypothetical protein